MAGASALLGRKHSIVAAEKTLKGVHQAVDRGDLRLAVSRAITAIVQATSAAMSGPREVVERANRVIQEVRQVIHGAVIRRMSKTVAGLGAKKRKGPRGLKVRGSMIPPWVTRLQAGKLPPSRAKQIEEKKFRESVGLKTFTIREAAGDPGGTVIVAKNPWLLSTLLLKLGIPGEHMSIQQTGPYSGLLVERKPIIPHAPMTSAKYAVEMLTSILKHPTRATFFVKEALTKSPLSGMMETTWV